MRLLQAILGMINFAAIIAMLYYSPDHVRVLYLGSVLAWAGIEINKQLAKDKK
mgnify:CR=1 FL=1|tara:strand:- start:563 stop:721 length:159 start_codon:yes stop_codon:yes gene_type:complete